MKKINKTLSVFLTLLLAFTVIGCIALASGTSSGGVPEAIAEKPAEKEGYFLYYDQSATNKYSLKANSTFAATFKDMAEGDVIKLLSDVTATTTGGTLAAPGGTGIYIDLNGYNLSIETTRRTSSSAYLIQPKAGCKLYIYSSDNANKGRICTYGVYEKNGAVTRSDVLFNIRYSNVEVHMGGTSSTPLLSYSDTNFNSQTTYQNTSVLSSGDNMEVFTRELFSPYYNTSSQTAPIGSKFCINGGTYYAAAATPLMSVGYVETDVSDARFISTAPGGSLFTLGGTNANLTVDNSLLYCEGTAVSNVAEAAGAEIKFTDCYIYGSQAVQKKSGTPVFENCHMSSEDAYFDDGINTKVRSNAYKTVKLASATGVLNEAGSITSWDIYDLGEKTLSFTVASATEESAVDITWNTPEGIVTEGWFKSEDVTPIPPVANRTNDVYVYEYSPEITSTENIIESAAYTLIPKINFKVRASLSFNSDFIYSLYVPTYAVNSELFNFARIDSKTEGTFSEGSIIDPAACEIKTVQISNTLTEECYVFTKTIPASEGDLEYRLVISFDGFYSEGEITHTQEFSIPDYVERINEGNFGTAMKNMANAAMTYVKAARNYAEESDTLPYPYLTNSDLVAVAGTAYSNRVPASLPPASISDAFQSIGISLADGVKFEFLINPDYFDGENTVTFTYPVYGTEVAVNVTPSDCIAASDYLRYEISLSAFDLRENIEIDLSANGEGVDYTYNLANFVSEVYNPTESESPVNTLLDAIWAYSSAAYNCMTTPGYDVPNVEIKIGGDNTVDSVSYVIVALGDAELVAAAELQAAIYAKTGELLEIVSSEADGKSSIKLNLLPPSLTKDFTVRVSGDDLIFDCYTKSYLSTAVGNFIEKHILSIETDKNFEDAFREEYFAERIYYSDFGIEGVNFDTLPEKYLDLSIWHGEDLDAIRSTLTNNFFEIKAAHDFANESLKNQILTADAGAVYYISETLSSDGTAAEEIVIERSVDFGDAAFIIDDSDIPSFTGLDDSKYLQGAKHLFLVKSTYAELTVTDRALLDSVTAAGLNPATTEINLGLGYSAMIIPEDNTPATHKVYRRRNTSQYLGENYREVILIDESGSVDPSTPVIFNYTSLKNIKVYRTDIPEITVQGGIFYTVDSDINCAVVNGESVTRRGGYIHRGIDVRRSNTVIKDVTHKVIGEFTLAEEDPINPLDSQLGAQYEGFFNTNNATDVTYLGCTFRGRRNYGVGTANASSYEVRITLSNNVTFDSCIQSNFWVDAETGFEATESTTKLATSMEGGRYWGSGGSNDCKNLTYMNSTISRFDAHRGLYNGKIINSTINGIELTGFGEMLIQDSKIYAYTAKSAIFALRNDYGNHWDGTVKIENLDYYPYETEEYNYGDGTATLENGYEVSLVGHAYTNWYYGYNTEKSQFPDIVIENLRFYSRLGENDRLITPEEMGPVNLVPSNASFMKEANLHLQTTEDTDAILSVVDNDGDGYIDGTANVYPGGSVTTRYYNNYYFDTDGDGIADQGTYTVVNPALGIPIADFLANKNAGIRVNSRMNLNPVEAPDTIAIKDGVGYDYASTLREYLSITSFLDGTLIYVERVNADGSLISREVISGEYPSEPESDPELEFTRSEDSPIIDYQ